MIDNSKEYILCAAVRHRKRKGSNDIFDMEIGYRHGDIYQKFECRWTFIVRICRRRGLNDLGAWFIKKTTPLALGEDGFLTSRNRFVDRHEAMRIAVECGQVEARKAEVGDLTDDERRSFGISESEDKDYWRRLCRGYAPLFSEDLY